MKKSILILLLAFAACKTTPDTKNLNVDGNLFNVLEGITKSKKVVETALVTIKKEACAGDCPEFEVAITKDSILNYNGLKNVASLGKHQLKLSTKQFLKLENILKEANTVSLSPSYVDDTKSFLPITKISINDTTIKINLWKDAPESLINVYTFIEDLLYDQKYLEE
tara:strand:+ start:9567 stop:10067 length:501 start_codon:yes stop_codon:yes gene_type:complete